MFFLEMSYSIVILAFKREGSPGFARGGDEALLTSLDLSWLSGCNCRMHFVITI